MSGPLSNKKLINMFNINDVIMSATYIVKDRV